MSSIEQKGKFCRYKAIVQTLDSKDFELGVVNETGAKTTFPVLLFQLVGIKENLRILWYSYEK